LQLLVVSITCNDTCIAHCYFNHWGKSGILQSICFNR